MNPGKDFNQNISQLIEMLKKILSHIPSQGQPDPSFFKKSDQQNVHLNICFFNLLPIPQDDLDTLDDFYDDPHFFQSEGKEIFLDSGLTSADMEFLKRNGIRFL